MAKVEIHFEDVTVDGQFGATFSMRMEMTDLDASLPSEQVTPATGMAFAVRALFRNGYLDTYARENIDELIEEAALEVAVNENIAQGVG